MPATNVPITARRLVNLPADPNLPSLILIGDSTVRNGAGRGYGGQWGWGDFLAPYFKTNEINVVNRALGGTSSRTFYRDQWPAVKALLKPGDFVILQFGHNDASPINDTNRARGTIPGVGDESQIITNLITRKVEEVHSFGWYITKFVTDAKAHGATAIICSPIPHKQRWENGRDFASLAGWDAQVASNTGALFLDLTLVITAAYQQAGREKVETYFADKGTHTSDLGAQVNAACVIAGLKGLPGNPLRAFLSAPGEAIAPCIPSAAVPSTESSSTNHPIHP
jgi:lysophospholipase L1-like esterase